MNNNRPKMQGSINLLAIVSLVMIVLAGAYYYLDHQADLHADETMMSLVDDAKSQGIELSYFSIDTSPLTQSIEITNLAIKGNEQEADIQLGNVVMKGLNWQDLTQNQNKLPTEMIINIENGELHLKKSMIETSSELQALVRILGETIPFSTEITYKLDLTQQLLSVSLEQAIEENFVFNSEIMLGNMAWLTTVDKQQTHIPSQTMSEALNSSLNSLSITYKNDGLIEKIRTDMSSQTGQSNEQLTEQSIAQLQHLQKTSVQQWGPVFTHFIDEMIQFSSDPKQLKLDINPVRPLTGQDIMMAFMSGEAGLIKLVDDAQITLKAN